MKHTILVTTLLTATAFAVGCTSKEVKAAAPPKQADPAAAHLDKAKAETKGISLIGYLSHIQVELKQQAQEAGCDMVLARSAFSQNLPLIFKRHSTSI